MRIVALTNEGQLPMMKTMLNSAKKAGIPMNLFHCYILEEHKEAAAYNSKEYKSIAIRKLEAIYENMQKDPEVLWVDNDIIFFQNCLRDIQSHKTSFVMQDDIWAACMGFFLVRNNALSSNLFRSIINWLKVNIHLNVNDQNAFKECKKKHPLVRVSLLPREEYANGYTYFVENKRAKAKMFHCNWLATTPEKVEKIKSFGFWDESDDAFNLVNKYYI